MNDNEFIRQFEDCTLSPDHFHHQNHVRLAWLYLQKYDTLAAVARFSQGLKRYAASLGKATLYHETITFAYIFLIQERRARGGETTWQAFAEHNRDLLDWQDNILKRFYRETTLKSDLAKQVFLFPDKISNER
ncbi:MAG: hypothetical protein AB1757_02760 [Acidobacteriota bacterium]